MYKLKGNGVLNTVTHTWIPDGHRLWKDEYLPWINEGNTPDPEYTLEELAQVKIREVNAEANRRIDNLLAPLPSAVHTVKLLRKQIAGTIKPNEENELELCDQVDDQVDTIDTQKDNAETWLEDPARTYEEIEAYNPLIDPWI